ncbi:hypothetical protein VKI21_07005 [Cyanobacterium aponinum UTEX 3222]|uniref:hypothetical protein n=1 Tax=Cyanobacterium aponinum TaxID=379064 RepID=UPI00308EC200|nr:hypothetical protein VKI21_07005 [Cyanobacterium aponinum UTEX 3222]
MQSLWEFLDKHIEGAIALVIGGFIPIIIWFFSYYKKEILDDAEKTLNRATKRLDNELNIVKEKISLVKENIGHLEEKQDYLIRDVQKDLTTISQELEQLEQLKIELQGTRELMLLQNTSFSQQITDFKDFIKNHLFK